MKLLLVFASIISFAAASGLYGGHGAYLGAPIVSHTIGHHAPLVSHAVVAAPVVKTIVPALHTSHVVATHGLHGYAAPVLAGHYGGHLGLGHHGLYNSHLGGLYGHGLGHGLYGSHLGGLHGGLHGGLLIKK